MGGYKINSQVENWNSYYRDVIADFYGVKQYYPLSFLVIRPVVLPELAQIQVVAANRDLIDATKAVKTDFLGDYSRELRIVIPLEYREIGCEVYGLKWVDTTKLRYEDIHFYMDKRLGNYGYKLCVGTPESFPKMKNVILENIRTAENMMIAYEKIMTGTSSKLELIAYDHGDAGRKQYNKNRDAYRTRR